MFHYSIRGNDLRRLSEVLLNAPERDKLFKCLNQAARILGLQDGDVITIDYD